MHKIWYCHKNTLEFPDDMKLSNNRRISILYKILNTISNNILIWYAAIIYKKNTVVQCPCHRLIHCTQLRNLWFFPFFFRRVWHCGRICHIILCAPHTSTLPTNLYLYTSTFKTSISRTHSESRVLVFLSTDVS
jgi:hypothetical protein